MNGGRMSARVLSQNKEGTSRLGCLMTRHLIQPYSHNVQTVRPWRRTPHNHPSGALVCLEHLTRTTTHLLVDVQPRVSAVGSLATWEELQGGGQGTHCFTHRLCWLLRASDSASAS